MTSSRLSNDKAHLWRVCVFVRHQHGDETECPRECGHLPQTVQAVLDLFYVDNWLTGANLIQEAVQLRKELQ